MLQARAIGLWALLLAAPAAAESVSIELTPQGALKLELQARDRAAASALGAALARSLGCTANDTVVSARAGAWAFRATCTGAFRRTGHVVEGQLKFAAFRQALIKSGAGEIDVDIAMPNAPYSRALLPRGWDNICRNGVVRRKATIEPRELPARPVRVAVGYRPLELAMIFGPAPLVLLLALAMMVWLNRRASARAGAVDPRALWFAYIRSVTWGLTGLFFLWAAIWAGISGSFGGDTDVWALFSVWNGRSVIAGKLFSVFLYVMPAWVTALLCWLWTPRVFGPLRERDHRFLDTMMLFLVPALGLIVPANWTISALGKLGGLQFAPAGTRLLGAVGCGIGCGLAARYGRAQRTSLLAAGELADRLRALATRCSVGLTEIRVVPVRAALIGEPLEVEADRVAISDYALEVLTPAEIEAEAARRWSLPLRGWPDLRRVLILFASLLVGMALSLAVVFVLGIVALVLHVHATAVLARFSLAMGVGWALAIGAMINRGLTRRSIRRAAALVGDTEAVAGVSRKLAAAYSWSAPPVVSAAGLAPEEAHLPMERVFSSSWRSMVASVKAGATILTLSAPPVLVAVAARKGLLSPAPRWCAYLAAMCLALLLHSAISKAADCWAYRRLRKKLGTKMQMAEDGSTVFIGISPAARAMVYDGAYDWDAGFLKLAADRLEYHGELTRFELRREQITGIRIGSGAPHWSDPHWIYVSWRDGASGSEGTFPLILPRVRSPWRLTKQVRELHGRLIAWQRAAATGQRDCERPSLGLPAFPQVAATAPPNQLPDVLGSIAVVGVSTSLLAGFPLASEATLYFALVWTVNALWDLFGHRFKPAPETAAA